MMLSIALIALQDTAPERQARGLAARFGELYEPVGVEVHPATPDSPLPLRAGSIVNLAEVRARWELTEDQELALLESGFVVVPGRFHDEAREDFVEAYDSLGHSDVPILVTTDALLHLYQVQFDSSLQFIEEREFARDLRLLVRGLRNRCAEIEGPLAEIAGFALAYLAVADALISGIPAPIPEPRPVPEPYAARVEAELGLCRAHGGFEVSPLFEYQEDYSQYIPRGHYTRSDTLRQYFLGMMWLGRMTFLLKGSDPHGFRNEPALVSPETARRQTLAAALLTALLEGDLPDGRGARDVWELLYAVTGYYVGLADDLDCESYAGALRETAGEVTVDAVRRLAESEELLLRYRWELAKLQPPAIYSGTGNVQGPLPTGEPDPALLERFLVKTMGWRFMGQRFIPDSYWLGRLVYPTVADRYMPTGLDVMSILGSQIAREFVARLGLDSFPGYTEERARLSGEITRLSTADWNRNLYWSWLYCLKGLLEPVGPGYPAFMRTPAWEAKTLDTALASWAELRHATILYAKQSYTARAGAAPGPPPPPPPGYVEPRPEVYARLLAVNSMTLRGLDDLGMLDDAARRRLEAMDELLARVTSISVRQLEGSALTEDDQGFLRGFAAQLGRAAVGIRDSGTSTVMAADVHTDSNSGRVLEAGVGRIALCLAAFPAGEGSFYVAAGPVLTYYEFTQPMEERLTDEAWRERIDDDPPELREWSRRYRR